MVAGVCVRVAQALFLLKALNKSRLSRIVTYPISSENLSRVHLLCECVVKGCLRLWPCERAPNDYGVVWGTPSGCRETLESGVDIYGSHSLDRLKAPRFRGGPTPCADLVWTHAEDLDRTEQSFCVQNKAFAYRTELERADQSFAYRSEL